MRYKRGYRSKNTEYVGRASGGGAGLGGLPGGIKGLGAGGGLIGIILVAILAFTGGGGGAGGNVGGGLGNILGGGAETSQQATDQERNDFFEFTFDNIQGFWIGTFAEAGQPYEEATLNIFVDGVQTGGCGFASSQVGPFYCPADQGVYLDEEFFNELLSRFGADGDFAQAYVIAHELGHHVQNVTGQSASMRQQQQGQPQEIQNQLSVRLELQADCLAGVWANWAEDFEDDFDGDGDLEPMLERGDVTEAIRAAEAVGDDRIQEATVGRTDPHSYTHGTAEQRARWLDAGWDAGSTSACDTFSGSYESL